MVCITWWILHFFALVYLLKQSSFDSHYCAECGDIVIFSTALPGCCSLSKGLISQTDWKRVFVDRTLNNALQKADESLTLNFKSDLLIRGAFWRKEMSYNRFLDALAILISRINSSLLWVFSWDFVDSKKNRLSPALSCELWRMEMKKPSYVHLSK